MRNRDRSMCLLRHYPHTILLCNVSVAARARSQKRREQRMRAQEVSGQPKVVQVVSLDPEELERWVDAFSSCIFGC